MRRRYRVNLWIGEINTKAIRRQKITILQNFGAFSSRTRKEDMRTPICCVSNSPSCQPYSVECESGGRAILRKAGYPLLFIQIFEDSSVQNITECCSLICKLKEFRRSGLLRDDTESGEQLLSQLKDCHLVDGGGRRCRFPSGALVFGGYEVLVVRGSPRLKVEVKVSSVQFLDWTTAEVTVTTTEVI